ncbi:MAG: serine/threonine protein kinase, partial [Cyanobacteria bacterium RYN_339]|nr:serine/threonine protein kinase [Cyanobacteria bacterium RYN_339]
MRGGRAALWMAVAGLWACQPNTPVKVGKLPLNPAQVVSNGGGSVVSNGGGALVGTDGAGVVANNGHQIVANNSGNLTGQVKGPSAGVLANNGGAILSGNAASLLANNGGGYRLAYSDTDVTLVSGASVALTDLSGQALGVAVTTGADGRFSLGVPKDAPAGVLLRATYAADGRALTLAALVPGSGASDLAVDPASTLAAKQLAAGVASGKIAAADASPALAGKLASTLAPFMSARAAVGAAVVPDAQAMDMVSAMSAASPTLAGRLATAAGTVTALIPPAATPTPGVGATTSTPGPGASPTPALAGIDANLTFARGLAALRAFGDNQGGSGLGSGPTTLQLKQVNGMALAPDGRLFVVDAGNQQIRALGPTGAVVVAGLAASQPVDGPLATQTGLQDPVGVLYDPRTDSLAVADSGSGRIRKFAIGGGIHAIAGGGGDGGATVAQATNAALGQPWGLAGDNQENLYFTDRTTGRLRRIEHGGRLTTLAGFTPFKLGPLAINALGSLAWVGDGNQVRLVAGLPAAPAVEPAVVFEAPSEVTALAFDPAGRLYMLVAAVGGARDARLWRLNVGADGKARGAAEAV